MSSFLNKNLAMSTNQFEPTNQFDDEEEEARLEWILSQAVAREQMAIQSAIHQHYGMSIPSYFPATNKPMMPMFPSGFQINYEEEEEEEEEGEESPQIGHQMNGQNWHMEEDEGDDDNEVGVILNQQITHKSPRMTMASTASASSSSSDVEHPSNLNSAQLCRAKGKYILMMMDREEKRARVRKVLSQEKYSEYLAQLKAIQMSPKGPNYRETRILQRFSLDPSGNCLFDQKSGKPYLSYENMFDCIHQCYLRPRYGGMRAFYAELKRKYANITMECINVYLMACRFGMK